MMKKILIVFLISCFTALGVHGGTDKAVDKTGISENSATQTTSQIDTVSKVDEIAEEPKTVCDDGNSQSPCVPNPTQTPECNKTDSGCSKVEDAPDCQNAQDNNCTATKPCPKSDNGDCSQTAPAENANSCEKNTYCNESQRGSCGKYTVSIKDGFKDDLLSVISDFIKSGEKSGVPKEADSQTQSTPSYNQPSLSNERAQVYDLVNIERAKNGLPALSYREDLQSAADLRAKEIVQLFSHTRPNGKSCFTAVTDAGISYRALGENIAYGQRNAEAVMNGWMNSSGHRANILSSNYTGIAVGFYEQNGVKYWVQIFIR